MTGLQQNEIIYIAVLSVLIALILVGNILLCIVFFLYQRLRTVTNYFIISLACSDIFVALVPMPIFLYFIIKKTWPPMIQSDTFALIDVITCVSSIGNLTLISIDRYFAVVVPLKRKAYMTRRKSLFMIGFIWIWSVSVASANQLLPFNEYTYVIMLLGVLAPFIIMIFAYVAIFYTVQKSRKVSKRSVAREWKVAKTILIAITVFFLCWTPFLVVNLYVVMTMKPVSQVLVYGVKWLQYFNSSCNPIIYGLFHDQFATAIKSFLRKCLGKPDTPFKKGSQYPSKLTMSTGAKSLRFDGSSKNSVSLGRKEYQDENLKHEKVLNQTNKLNSINECQEAVEEVASKREQLAKEVTQNEMLRDMRKSEDGEIVIIVEQSKEDTHETSHSKVKDEMAKENNVETNEIANGVNSNCTGKVSRPNIQCKLYRNCTARSANIS
ncbi:histamine H2 receptor-like [Hydractinia symbiolongicarpus]|uniref:histamine H2 receptor-like n=1 Tax=Hydractinia symbiolongicarpus TaxID=13093 RepID=UPI0025518E74|nr:histamine H2 receptor-like [Hydractinia symbiolongicarpus]